MYIFLGRTEKMFIHACLKETIYHSAKVITMGTTNYLPYVPNVGW